MSAIDLMLNLYSLCVYLQFLFDLPAPTCIEGGDPWWKIKAHYEVKTNNSRHL